MVLWWCFGFKFLLRNIFRYVSWCSVIKFLSINESSNVTHFDNIIFKILSSIMYIDQISEFLETKSSIISPKFLTKQSISLADIFGIVLTFKVLLEIKVGLFRISIGP